MAIRNRKPEVEVRKDDRERKIKTLLCDTYLEIVVIAVLELGMAEDERAVAHVRIRILVCGGQLTTARHSIGIQVVSTSGRCFARQKVLPFSSVSAKRKIAKLI